MVSAILGVLPVELAIIVVLGSLYLVGLGIVVHLVPLAVLVKLTIVSVLVPLAVLVGLTIVSVLVPSVLVELPIVAILIELSIVAILISLAILIVLAIVAVLISLAILVVLSPTVGVESSTSSASSRLVWTGVSEVARFLTIKAIDRVHIKESCRHGSCRC